MSTTDHAGPGSEPDDGQELDGQELDDDDVLFLGLVGESALKVYLSINTVDEMSRVERLQ